MNKISLYRTCKGICENYPGATKGVGWNGYGKTKKRCRRCEMFFLTTEEMHDKSEWCPCCHSILRNRPLNKPVQTTHYNIGI